MLKKCLFLLLIICLIVAAFPTFAQDQIATTTANLNVRATPDRNGVKLGQLPYNTQVILEARADNNQWVLGRAVDGSLRGWLSVAYLDYAGDINALPVSAETFVPAPVVNPSDPAVPALPAPIGSSTLSAAVIRSSQTIFQRGQTLGNQPNMIIKIGDSNSGGNDFNITGYAFLCAYTYNAFNFGNYGHLAHAVNFFNQNNGLCQPTISAQNGFTTGSVLDETWSASIPGCTADETPLACAVRVYRPSVAVIYFGMLDLTYLTPAESRRNYNTMITYLKNQGVIPVLTTFTMADDFRFAPQAPAHNRLIREMAANHRIPLIEFQQAAYNLPNRGTNDGYHLTYNDTGLIAFTGEEAVFGWTLRHLLTLQVLFDIQTQVMGY